MKIAVITPYYEGKRFLDKHIACIRRNNEKLPEDITLIDIIVNDSPWEEINTRGDCGGECIIVSNENNVGIHGSRVHGLNIAIEQGCEYCIFLDQDDILEDEAILTFAKIQEKKPVDIQIANAKLEQKNWSDVWIRGLYQAMLVWDKKTYLTVGTQIISPGQCMIRTDSIPKIWRERILTKNGSDDYFLWLLMICNGASYNYIDIPLYKHTYTGENISGDTSVTDDSIREFVPILIENGVLSKKDGNTLLKMIKYKNSFRNGNIAIKLFSSIAHPGIFASNLFYKLFSKTKYGFNR